MFISLIIKKTIPAASVILFFLFVQIAWSGNFTESPHDFRKYPWNRSGENCLPCHVMQGTKTSPAPLWNPASSTQTYIMYGSTFPPAKGSVADSPPDGMSKKCLSCHDGIIASDTYGPNTGGHAFRFDGDFTGIIPNNNHPVSFVYDTALATKYGDLYDPSTRLSGVNGISGTINDLSAGLSEVADGSGTANDPSTGLSEEADSSGTINADMLFSNRMECSSCHDVHNTKAVPGTKLLVKDIAGSALCLTCHNK
jgi:predicted CXXCH cytochrome family protein